MVHWQSMRIRHAKIALLLAAGAAALMLWWPENLSAQILPYRFQYAVKFACGPATFANNTMFEAANYRTAANIHNPTSQNVTFRYKAALAKLYADGPISPFTTSTIDTIGPDAAQVFDCEKFYVLLGLSVNVPPQSMAS